MRRRRGNLTRESYNLILFLFVVRREKYLTSFFWLPNEVGGLIWPGNSIKKRDLEKIENMTLGRVLSVGRKKLFDILIQYLTTEIRVIPK